MELVQPTHLTASPHDSHGLRPRGILTFNDHSGTLWADPPAMSASQILQHLYSLDTSSPGISRLLHGLIRHDEEEQYLSSLQGSELARLIDFLDEVRTHLSPFAYGYETNPGPWRHRRHRRSLPTMFAQTTNPLRRKHDPPFLIYRIWQSSQSW